MVTYQCQCGDRNCPCEKPRTTPLLISMPDLATCDMVAKFMVSHIGTDTCNVYFCEQCYEFRKGNEFHQERAKFWTVKELKEL